MDIYIVQVQLNLATAYDADNNLYAAKRKLISNSFIISYLLTKYVLQFFIK